MQKQEEKKQQNTVLSLRENDTLVWFLIDY